MDTASLTQADQAMIFFSGNNTNDHAHMEGHDNHPTMHHNTMSTATSCDQSAAAACAQTGTEKSSKRRKKSIECRETISSSFNQRSPDHVGGTDPPGSNHA